MSKRKTRRPEVDDDLARWIADTPATPEVEEEARQLAADLKRQRAQQREALAEKIARRQEKRRQLAAARDRKHRGHAQDVERWRKLFAEARKTASTIAEARKTVSERTGRSVRTLERYLKK